MIGDKCHLLFFGERPHLLACDLHRQISPGYKYLPGQTRPLHGQPYFYGLFPKRKTQTHQGDCNPGIEQRVRAFHLDMLYRGFVHTLSCGFGLLGQQPSVLLRPFGGQRIACEYAVRRHLDSGRHGDLQLDLDLGGLGKREFPGKV